MFSLDKSIGDISTGSLTGSNNSHHLSSLQSKIPIYYNTGKKAEIYDYINVFSQQYNYADSNCNSAH